ncbi:WD40 containing snare-dependent exocytosis protein [Phlegmacium glaucopus]|nr:WD40 containing snare-dependent exocytosis protein [Phlegmacium glaucopus]
MLSKHPVHLADLSSDIRDELDWKIGSLRTLEFPLNITSLAIEPVTGLLAAGTSSGAIYIFGKPGVESKLTLPQSAGIRFVHFATSTSNIVCLDDNNTLHIWDLLNFGRPKLVASAHFDQSNSITLCPSHAHVFLSMHNGDVKTYDLACLRKSKYSMPNMWKLYEEMITATGAPTLTPPSLSTSVETVIHPRNLNLVFVAYAGGVILTDLTERSTLRAYELVLLPGAPGGAGYGEDILTHRRLTVTCLAVHPSGHLFAVGYTDGSIAFWAVEDDDQPLLVRTLNSTDVNLVDSDALEAHLDSKENKAQKLIREPIFKLSWSSFSNSTDPRGGDTTLTVLGGLDPTQPPGLTVLLLPPFNPTEPPSTPLSPHNENLHPFFRSSMIKSLNPLKSFFYETIGVVQDYLLIPRNSPHFVGNFDPYAILLLTESTHHARTVHAYQYPPPGFIKNNIGPLKAEIKEEEEDEELSSAGLQSPPPPTPPEKSPRHVNHTPSSVRTPFILSAACSDVLGGHLIRLENDVYQSFVDKDVHDLHLTLNGGQAYADPDLNISKFQPHRVLVTYNRDRSIQFFDMSTQLLIPKDATLPDLDQDFPKPLPGLTVQLDDLLDDSSIAEILKHHIDSLTIQSVHVAPEALECAVALTSGDIVVYRPSMGLPPSKIVADIEIILLDGIRSTPTRRLEPYFMLTPNRGSIATCAISDTGFLAVSYTDGSLIVVDMRGPEIILSHEGNKKTKHKLQSPVHVHANRGDGPSSPRSAPDIAKSLTWTISQLDNDSKLSVRLIVAYQSGHADIYTLVHSGNPVTWSIIDEPVPCKAVVDPLPNGTFVVDTKGVPVRADRKRLGASYQGVLPAGTQQSLMITVGAKGARCNLNIDGEKMGKAEWGSKVGLLQSAQIVEHMRSHALVVQFDRHNMLVFSIPHLEYLHTAQLPPVSSLPMTIDTSGDFIAWTADPVSKFINSATYGTFFDIRRANTLPDIEFVTTQGIPPQPQPVSLGPASFLGSWFSFNQTKSGEQIDELLGGPDRPIIEKRPEGGAGGTSEEAVAGTAASAASSLAANAAAVQSSIYNRLSSAMAERGQMLGDLEQRFNSLEEGSRGLVEQAKRLAAQQTAKGWFGF